MKDVMKTDYIKIILLMVAVQSFCSIVYAGEGLIGDSQLEKIGPEIEDVQVTYATSKIRLIIVAHGQQAKIDKARVYYFNQQGDIKMVEEQTNREGIFHFALQLSEIDNPFQYWVEVFDEGSATAVLGSREVPLTAIKTEGLAGGVVTPEPIYEAPINEQRRIAPGWVALCFAVGGLSAALATTYWASARLGKNTANYDNDAELQGRVAFDERLSRIFGIGALVGLGTGSALWGYNNFLVE